MEEDFDAFLKQQALQNVINRQYKRLKYLTEHVQKILMLYTKFKDEEKL